MAFLVAGLALATVIAAGCAGGGKPRATGPTTTLLTADYWSPPPVGPAGTDTFCALVVSVYKHMAQIPLAANTTIRSQIVGDYVSTAPLITAAAPPQVAADAKLYFSSVSNILSALRSAGLDPRKVPNGQIGSILLDPTVKSAGNNVFAFTQANCHYAIGP